MKDGGPAFPESVRTTDLAGNPLAIIKNGMTLRDYFAAHARFDDGDITWGEVKRFHGLPDDTDIGNWTEARTLAYKVARRYAYADAMIREREKGQK